MACSNCGSDFDSAKGGLLVTQKGVPVTSVCDSCLEGSRVVKVVLERGEIGNFRYKQFATLEALSGGLTSPRRAG